MERDDPARQDAIRVKNSRFPEVVGRTRIPSASDIATRIELGKPVIDRVSLASVVEMDDNRTEPVSKG